MTAPQEGRRRPGHPVRVAALLSVLIGGLLVSIGTASASPAAAVPVEFAMRFSGLVPGQPQTQSAPIALDRDAVLEALAWDERTGVLADSTLLVTVCQRGRCVSDTAFQPTPMLAGNLEVRVTVTASDEATARSAGTALGRLTFRADDDEGELAATGPAGVSLLAAGAALLATGVLLATTATRRRPRARGDLL